MDKFIEFVGNNYVWFLTVSILLLFALIGYIYDNKKNKNDLIKKSESELAVESLEKMAATNNKSLSDMVSKSKNINPETMSVELTDKSILENKNNPVPENNLEQNTILESENAISMVTTESSEIQPISETTNNVK